MNGYSPCGSAEQCGALVSTGHSVPTLNVMQLDGVCYRKIGASFIKAGTFRLANSGIGAWLCTARFLKPPSRVQHRSPDTRRYLPEPLSNLRVAT
jgi:hypothetical protein